jgi:F-type H+-transporting ATPase subunit delta
VTGRESIAEGMPGRYATALFELAREGKSLDAVADALARFQSMLDASADLVRLVRSPVFTADEQMRAVTAVLDKAEIGGLAANFIKLVAKNRRLFAVADMISAYRGLLAAHRGEVTAEVASAHALTAAQVKSLKASLKKAVGSDVQLDASVDATLLGGLVVKVGSRMIDNSLRTKLNNLKIAMKEVG